MKKLKQHEIELSKVTKSTDVNIETRNNPEVGQNDINIICIYRNSIYMNFRVETGASQPPMHS